jgi:hypothetical protein
MKKGYKECPFCANEIKEWARKCQYCKEFLDDIDKNSKKTWEKIWLKGKSNQIKSCIKFGNKWLSLCWVTMLWFPLVLILGMCSKFLDAEAYNTYERTNWIIIILLIVSIIYYFIWLIKNYRILFDIKKRQLTCNSTFNLIICWICPILNLYKPQKTLHDLLKNNIGDNYDNKMLKKRWIAWDITLLSFVLIFCPPVRFSILAIVVYIVSNVIQVNILMRIVKKIIKSQELWIKNFDNN